MRRQGSPSWPSFGKIDVTGPDARRCLETVCTNRIDRPVGAPATR